MCLFRVSIPILFTIDPQTPRRRQLTQDQCLQLQILRASGLDYRAIARHLSCTERQVKNVYTRSYPTPKKHTGRPLVLSTDQQNELVQYICQLRFTRRLSYLQLSLRFERWGVSEYVIRSVLRKHGFCYFACAVT